MSVCMCSTISYIYSIHISYLTRHNMLDGSTTTASPAYYTSSPPSPATPRLPLTPTLLPLLAPLLPTLPLTLAIVRHYCTYPSQHHGDMHTTTHHIHIPHTTKAATATIYLHILQKTLNLHTQNLKTICPALVLYSFPLPLPLLGQHARLHSITHIKAYTSTIWLITISVYEQDRTSHITVPLVLVAVVGVSSLCHHRPPPVYRALHTASVTLPLTRTLTVTASITVVMGSHRGVLGE